jgi:hypothetical protein
VTLLALASRSHIAPTKILTLSKIKREKKEEKEKTRSENGTKYCVRFRRFDIAAGDGEVLGDLIQRRVRAKYWGI